MRILLTNDDGITAPGMAALYRIVADLGEVHVVAPTHVRSATSHAVTLHKPIPTARQQIEDAAGKPVFVGFAVDGNPADCVKLALHHLVPQPINVVLSGINSGANAGINVFYSGTVGAAREAAIWGVPALAVSLTIDKKRAIPWARAQPIARQLLQRILQYKLASHTLLNINLPNLDEYPQPLGVRVVGLSTSRMVEEYSWTDDVAGQRHFQMSDRVEFHEMLPDTDVEALHAGYITVTPLNFDPTCGKTLRSWQERLR